MHAMMHRMRSPFCSATFYVWDIKLKERQCTTVDTDLFLGTRIELMTVSVDCKQMEIRSGCEVYFAVFPISVQL